MASSEPAEKPRVTEIKVRMDCNGCVQKIKKALHGIIGITEVYIDFPQQKVTIVGWADPEKIIKAIKKTRKKAVICLHSEQSEQPSDQTAEGPTGDGSQEGGAPPGEANDQGAEPPQQGEQVPPHDQPSEPPPAENPLHEPNPPPESTGATMGQSHPPMPPDGGEVHVVYHYPPDQGYRHAYDQNVYQGYGRRWAGDYPEDPRYRREQGEPTRAYSGPWTQPGASAFRREPPQPQGPPDGHSSGPWSHPETPRFRMEPPQAPQPISVNYNTYKPSPYVTEYAYPQPPPSYNSNYRRQGGSEPREAREYSYNTHRPLSTPVEIRPVETQEYNNNTYRPSGPEEPRPIETREQINTYRPSPAPMQTRPIETQEYIPYRSSSGPIDPRPVETREYNNAPYRSSSGPVETREYSNNTYRPPPGPVESRPIETREYHNYNTYRPSPYTTEYAYSNSRSAPGFNPYGPTPHSYYSPYLRQDSFNQEYYNGNHGNGNVTSMFSEENPNACTIV